MRASTLAFGAMVTLAAAQRMSDSMPECAVECLEDGIESATDCALDDGDCICEVDNYRNTYDSSTACVLQACGAAAALDEVLPAAARFCSEVTDGATAPPVDESPSSTGSTTVPGATDVDATASPTSTPTISDPEEEEEEEGEESGEDEPDAAAVFGPAGTVAAVALALGLWVIV